MLFRSAPHIHHRLTRYATNSAIYVKPERRGFAGGKLVLGCESLLREAGAQKVVYAVPEGAEKLAAMLRSLGYKRTEDFLCKTL